MRAASARRRIFEAGDPQRVRRGSWASVRERVRSGRSRNGSHAAEIAAQITRQKAAARFEERLRCDVLAELNGRQCRTCACESEHDRRRRRMMAVGAQGEEPRVAEAPLQITVVSGIRNRLQERPRGLSAGGGRPDRARTLQLVEHILPTVREGKQQPTRNGCQK